MGLGNLRMIPFPQRLKNRRRFDPDHGRLLQMNSEYRRFVVSVLFSSTGDSIPRLTDQVVCESREERKRLTPGRSRGPRLSLYICRKSDLMTRQVFTMSIRLAGCKLTSGWSDS